MKLNLFAINVECDVAVIKITRTENCILLYKIRGNYDNNSNTTAPFVRCIEEIKIQVSILFLHESTYSAHIT